MWLLTIIVGASAPTAIGAAYPRRWRGNRSQRRTSAIAANARSSRVRQHVTRPRRRISVPGIARDSSPPSAPSKRSGPQWRRPLLALLAVATLTAVAGCGSAGTGGSAVHVGQATNTTTVTAPTVGPTSIVQLGDSIAAGEGTYYGYTYDPSTGKWTGGNLAVTWDPPYNGCHDASYAYVYRVAKYFRELPKGDILACTGATFGNGISVSEISDGMTLRPAEFGNWDTKQDLNPVYDAAKPDLVLITLGHDVQFVNV